MKVSRPKDLGQPAIDLLEEAVHLLRTAPLGALALYYAGTIPFVLAFLFFWSDMSRSALAEDRLAPLAGGLAVLFAVMKLCHAGFGRQLREFMLGQPLPQLSCGQWLGIASVQTFWQATGLIVMPVALTILLPAGWCYAFYQNLSALGAVTTDPAANPVREAARQALRWPRQNHLVLVIVSALYPVVLINVAIVLYGIPFLLKTLLGIETGFTQGIWAIFNTTFLATAFAVAWLCVDPLLKALYVLRCFQGQAVATGEDIRLDLRAHRERRKAELVVALTLAMLVAGSAGEPRSEATIGSTREAAAIAPDFRAAAGASSALTNVVAAPASTSPLKLRASRASPFRGAGAELNQAIDEVLQRREYAWRLPRERIKQNDAQLSWLGRTVQRVRDWLSDTLRSMARSIFEFFRWLLDKLFGRGGAQAAGGQGWGDAVRGMFILLLVVLVAAIGYLGYRLWRNHRNNLRVVTALPVATPPNLDDDNVTAAQLPEDEWLRLARELIAQGELRLALRAFYLAALAHLSGRGLLTIARHKSNHDYELELDRRSHALPEVMRAFTTSVAAFDRVWYGRHEITRDALAEFESNVRRIRGG